jgi:hypothetical protein
MMQSVVAKSLKSLSGVCSKRGWDGKSANAIPANVFRSAFLFMEKMPKKFPLPCASALPSGSLILEWTGGETSSIRIVFKEQTAPRYEAHLSGQKKTGKIPSPEFFASILRNALDSRSC